MTKINERTSRVATAIEEAHFTHRPDMALRLPEHLAVAAISAADESRNDAIKKAEFCHAENGMTRFPPNVEQIVVEHESCSSWLIVSRNDVKLRFPLIDADCRHLAKLLMAKVASE